MRVSSPTKFKERKHIPFKTGDAITFKYGDKRLNGLVINGRDTRYARTGKVWKQHREVRIYGKSGFEGITSLDLSNPKYQVRRRSTMTPVESNYFSKEKK